MQMSTDEVRALRLQCVHQDLANAKASAAASAKEPDPSKRLDYSKCIKNIEFLIRFYEDGGDPPPPGAVRWVVNEQFVEKPTGRRDWLIQLPDFGLQFQYANTVHHGPSIIAAYTTRP